jgi:putative PIN family toxin of toxin-antitoxin system
VIVVIDTNIWISALCFGNPNSTFRRVLETARTHHQIAIAREIEAEIVQTLVRKFEWPEERAHRAVVFILRHPLRVKLDGMVRVCRDPKDDTYLECAVLSRADLLITGDKDLLVHGSYEGTQIVTPIQFLELAR